MLSIVRSRRAVVATMIGSIGMNTGPVAAAMPVERLIVSRGHLICGELALRCAAPGDAVLIAGKGHEDYQIVGTQKRPFDDRQVARRALQDLRS